MSSNFHVFLPEPPCKMSLSTPPVSWMLPESDIPLAIQPRKSYNKSINCAFYIISGCGCRMDTYAYLAHLTEDGRTQTILEHLKGTASLCSAFAAAFDAEAQGQLAGMAHDIGKYSAAFQRRLHGGPKVDHASAGAFECLKAQQLAAAFAISGSEHPRIRVRPRAAAFCTSATYLSAVASASQFT